MHHSSGFGTYQTYHLYPMGSGGGGGADFEGEYYGNEINIQKNSDNITLNFNNKQIVLTPGGDGVDNDNNNKDDDYNITGGIGGNIDIPTDLDEWLNIVSNNGQSGTSTQTNWITNVNEFLHRGYDGTITNYTPPDVNDSFHIAGGSPRGGRGVVGGSIGEPNATLRLGGQAYLKLEWFERPEN